MKRLLVLRHAKAVARDAAEDFDRVLSDRGRDQMAVMAGVLAQAGAAPDLALVSPSARTRETCSLAGLKAGATRFERAIYEAQSETLLTLVRQVDEKVHSLILIGHNPGLEELCAHLVAARSRKDAAALARGLPTAALAIFEFDVETWREVAFGTGRLVSFTIPESAGSGD